MKKLANYLKGVREEFAKIVFPGRKDVIAHTTMVVVSIIVAVAVIGVIDLGLAQIVKLVFVKTP